MHHSPILISIPSMQVPAAVSHSEFWHRYFYKVHQLEQVCWPNLGRPHDSALGEADFCQGKKELKTVVLSGGAKGSTVMTGPERRVLYLLIFILPPSGAGPEGRPEAAGGPEHL